MSMSGRPPSRRPRRRLPSPSDLHDGTSGRGATVSRPPRVLALEGARARRRAEQLASTLGGGVSVVAGRQLPAEQDAGDALELAADVDLVVIDERSGAPALSSVPGGPARGAVRLLVVKTPPRLPYRRVLIGVDGTSASRAAVEAAVTVAPGARWTAVHVVPDSVVEHRLRRETRSEDVVSEFRRAVLDDARRKLADVLSDLPQVTTAVGPGQPEQVLAELVRRFGFDLVVLGASHGRRLRRMLFGSVAENVLEAVACDVLIVPPEAGRL